MKIRTKIIFSFVAAAFLPFILFVFQAFEELEEVRSYAFNDARNTAASIALVLTSFDRSTGEPVYRQQAMLSEYIRDFHREFGHDIVVVDKDKNILWDAIEANIGTTYVHDLENEVGMTIKDGVARAFIEKSVDYPQGIRELVVPIRTRDGSNAGAVIFEYTSYYDTYLSDITSETKRHLIEAVLIMLIVAGAGYVISGRIAMPIIRLEKASREISRGNFDARVEITSKDETGSLTASFNHMTERLYQARSLLMTEIEEHKKAEEKLRLLAERETLVLNSLPMAFYTTGTDLAATWISDKVGRITGFEPSSFVNDPCLWISRLHPDDATRSIKAFEKVFEHDKTTLEYRWLCADGRYRWFHDNAVSVRDQNGEPKEVVGVWIDITERKVLELEKERLLDKLERSNRELNDFAYIVSHDLKAPLRAIGTITNWLAQDYKDVLDESGREQLSILLNRTQRLHNMIEAILQYSRAGRISGNPAMIDSSKVLRDAIDALTLPDNFKISVQDSMPTVYFDPIRLTQVFQNLVSNAIKYIDKPQGLIDVGYKDDKDAHEFYVSDNGPGIEERHFDRIFQIFQTLKPRDEFESTGIGLSIVKKIIEHEGGRIWAESEMGKGSTFHFTIPKRGVE